ncbi:hypothetical protein [[Ruminococcus] lactaris]|uniref:hypothetical protein n=1 Tax=[Ruminococcus] lactaris TaxID=46228 RepID=UPI0035213FEE
MKVIGITGGVGSGKSAVLACLEQEYGACSLSDGRSCKAASEKRNRHVSRRS